MKQNQIHMMLVAILLLYTSSARAQYLYEMQGYDHGSMPQPAYKILKDHIRRLTAKMASSLPN